MTLLEPPSDRSSFHVAIVCALPLEADAVALLFDHFWDEDHDRYGRSDGDVNTYITGRIGGHDVVLAVLPGMGTTEAAAATVNLKASYPRLTLVLLVGICGGVPKIDGSDAFLGDVVVSKTIIRYDYGRQYPGQFVAKDLIEDSLARPNTEIRGLLAVFNTELVRERLQQSTMKNLRHLQAMAVQKRRRTNYEYPGAANDRLYLSSYVHKHPSSCEICTSDVHDYCKLASQTSCLQIGCDETNLVMRTRPSQQQFCPEIFIGKLGSGNAIMRSGTDRDRIAGQYNILAFETEGAGTWDQVPCIIVKGISDYADSHKDKKWQPLSAATAASVSKAILERYPVSNHPTPVRSPPAQISITGEQSDAILARFNSLTIQAPREIRKEDTPFHIACSIGNASVVAACLDAGLDIHLRGWGGRTPLFLAAMKGQGDVIRLLLDRKVDINLGKFDGSTPLHTAIDNEKFGAVKLLIDEGAKLDIRNHQDRLPIHTAAWKGNTQILEFLLDRDGHLGDINITCRGGLSLVHMTVTRGHVDATLLLIKRGADLNIADERGWLPIHTASAKGHLKLLEILLQKGADPDALTLEGDTALELATESSHRLIVEVLERVR